MRHDPIFTSWPQKAGALWENQPLRLAHRLHESPLFSMDGLADLISRYPRTNYSLVHMGAKGEAKRFWREGEIGSLGGRQVVDIIANGRMGINPRDITAVRRPDGQDFIHDGTAS